MYGVRERIGNGCRIGGTRVRVGDKNGRRKDRTAGIRVEKEKKWRGEMKVRVA